MTDSHKALAAVERDDNPEKMHPLVRAAMRGGALDPATLRDLLTVQREWESGEAKKAYTRAMVALKRDLPAVLARDREVDFTGKSGQRTHYRHTSLAAAMDAVTGPLTAHGFSVSWSPSTTDCAVSVSCRLTHSEGHSETCALSAPPDAGGLKSAPQAIASTVTLLQRYTLLSLLGIATADHRDPQPQSGSSSDVDVSRNLKAAARLKKHGKTRQEAEKYLDRDVKDWTSGDLDRLRDWLAPKTAASERTVERDAPRGWDEQAPPPDVDLPTDEPLEPGSDG